MVNVDIEKEIDQENKIIFGLSLRQFIIVLATLAVTIAVMFILDWKVSTALYPVAVIAFIAGTFGWYKPNGQPFEKALFKGIQNFFFGGTKKIYKTKNQYVTMINAEYARRAAIDMSNKEIAKQIKKDKKKKKPKTTIKPIV